MCIRVRRAPNVTNPWNPDQRAITLPARLPDTALPTAIRAVLAELDITQPTSGAVCFCGAPVKAPQPTHH